MVDTPRTACRRRSNSPGRRSSERCCRLSDVGNDPLSEPGERKLMTRRPMEPASTDGRAGRAPSN
eukprot:6059261-Prymnesium_polylepis.1